MSRVLINGINSKSAGGRSVLINLAKSIASANDGTVYYLASSHTDKLLVLQASNIKLIETPNWTSKEYFAPIVYRYYIPKLCAELEISAILNLGDLLIRTDIPQIYLFDWAYLICNDKDVWGRMGLAERLKKSFKAYLIRRNLFNATIVVAQTDVAKSGLRLICNNLDVRVVANAVSVENLKQGAVVPDQRNNLKLLYLTRYYTHKNIEIFIALAEIIKDRKLPYRIITTIEQSQHKNAKKFLKEIKKRGLTDVIDNIGEVTMEDVPRLYKDCDALLMPTLLESFSGTYVEAMFHGLPIITSDRGFSRAVCGEAAVYFDPIDEYSIVEALSYIFEHSDNVTKHIMIGKEQLKTFPSWSECSEKYVAFVNEVIKKGKKHAA